MMRMLISQYAFVFAEIETARDDKEKLLSGLEEGIIILDKKKVHNKMDILYLNAAALGFAQ